MTVENDASVKFWIYFDKKERFVYECESYDCTVLFILSEGSYHFSFNDGERHIAKALDVVLCPPRVCFHREAITPVSLYMIKLDTGGVAPEAGIYSLESNNRLCENLRLLLSYFSVPQSPLTIHYCMDIWYDFLLNIEKNKHNSEKNEIIRMEKFIAENLSGDLSNGVLSRQMRYSEVTLIGKFRLWFGMTPQQYVTQKRMAKAKLLLTSTAASVGDAAKQCGYDDRLYFSKAFRKCFGVSPSKFNKESAV